MPNLATEIAFGVALALVRRDAAFDDLREVFLKRLGLRYRVAERHRSFDGASVAPEVHSRRAALAKPVPASDHPSAVVHVQLGFGFRKQLVQVHPDLLQVDVEYQDFVIRQDFHFDCLAESEAVKLRAVKAFVVHGRQRDSAVVARPALDGVAVDARGGGHVQPFFAGDEAVVVDAAEVGFGFACERRAGGSVRLVADYQVELGQPHPLRGGHGVQRLVRGEDDRHGGVALGVSVSRRESGGVRGRGQGQVERRKVGVVFAVIPQPARAGVGAYRERIDGNRGVVRPIPQRLRQQRYGRCEEQDAAARPRDFLGDAERSERLAGAASHDEFAALMLAESFDDVFKRQLLVFAQAFLRLSAQRSRTGEAEVFPVDGRILKHIRTPANDGFGLAVAEGVLGVSAPIGGRGDEHAAGELVGGVRAEKLVELAERYSRVGRVELGLDGDQSAAFPLPRHEVYAGVLPVAPLGVLRPQPNLVELLRLPLVQLDERLDQRLEHAPLLGRAARFGRQNAKNILERGRRLMLVLREEDGHSTLRVVQVHYHACIPFVGYPNMIRASIFLFHPAFVKRDFRPRRQGS